MTIHNDEEELYPIVGVFLRDKKGCSKVLFDPKVKFEFFGERRIDVAGLRSGKIIGVEVKKEFTPRGALEALQQATIYKRACSDVYVCFYKPEPDKVDEITLEKFKNECIKEGIGLIFIDSSRKVEEIVNPKESDI